MRFPKFVRLALVVAFALTTPAFAAGKKKTTAKPKATAAQGTLVAGVSARDALPNKIATMVSAGKKPVVIFDIDDTLVRQPGNREIKGAANYVKLLGQKGAKVVYLTGRKANEQTKTIATFKLRGLPTTGFTEFMFNNTSKKTVEWKRSAETQIRALGTPVAIFDNEWPNIRMFRSEYAANVSVFRLQTFSHKPDPGGAGKIFLVDHFD